MKLFLSVLSLPAFFFISACSKSSISDAFVREVWQERMSPSVVCKKIAPNYQITQFQQDLLSSGSCKDSIAGIQRSTVRAKDTAAVSISSKEKFALVCLRNSFTGKLILMPILLREEEGLIRRVDISPQVDFGGEEWEATAEIAEAGRAARDELHSACQELEIFPPAEQ